MMSYDAVSIKRFSIVFGFYHKKAWRLRIRLVVTTSIGIILFPVTKTLFIENGKFQVPEDYRANTVQIS